MANQSSILANFWGRFINFIIGPIDNAVATPINNAVFLDDIDTRQAYPGPDAKDPYPVINNSSDARFIKGGILGLAIFSILAAILINFYKKLRKKEGHSHYFFFEKIPLIQEWLKNHKNENECSPEILLATAHYYNPDIYSFVLGWRRAWAWLTQNKDYLKLQKHLKKEASEGKTKKDTLRETHKEILEKIALYINKQQKYGQWEVSESLIIQPTENTKAFSNQIIRAWNELQNKTQTTISSHSSPKKSVSEKLLDFIENRLDELAIGSYAYWIGVFAFYLLAGVGVIGIVVWPPILIAGIVLSLLWATKIYHSIQTKSVLSSAPENESVSQETEHTLLNESVTQEAEHALLLEAIQHQIQLKALSKKSVDFKNSKLKKDIEKTLRKNRDLRYVWPIFNGFIRGLFTVLFVGWLLTATLGLVVTLNPIGAAILAVVLLTLAITYGLYMAVKNYRANNLAIKTREDQWKTLKKLCENQTIPDLSLEEYDRLFRRHSADKTLWTSVKQFFKRAWVGFSRIGTGILFLKLTGLSVTTAICLALGITVSAAFFPMLGILLGAGVFFSAWHIYQYQLEGQQNKIDHVVKSLAYQSTIESNALSNTTGQDLDNQPLQLNSSKPLDLTNRSLIESLDAERKNIRSSQEESRSQENLIFIPPNASNQKEANTDLTIHRSVSLFSATTEPTEPTADQNSDVKVFKR